MIWYIIIIATKRGFKLPQKITIISLFMFDKCKVKKDIVSMSFYFYPKFIYSFYLLNIELSYEFVL